MDFKTYYNCRKELLEEQLGTLFSKDPVVSNFKEVMVYPLLNGGKRLRAILPLLVYDSFQKTFSTVAYPKDLSRLSLCMELLHTYSLVHDDLPAMDNDTLRRGKPTVHVQYDEAKAILAGDALLTQAFGLLGELEDLDGAQLKKMVRLIFESSGHLGMIGGQVLDMENENKSLSLEEITTIHQLKTGALITAAVKLPLIYLSKEALMEPFERYASSLGLAFQITDDILDSTGTTKSLGKTVGKDATQQKTTYTTLLGVEGAKKETQRVIHEAIAAIETLHQKGIVDGRYLIELARSIVDRKF